MECPNKRILCECVDTKIGLISVVGKHEPVFILELNAIDSGRTVIKYLNCKSSTNGRYTVAHNSDFAKLYRLTLGTNPTKRFSEAKHLLSHFLESQFYVDYEPATGSGGKHYLKATHIEPKTACMGEEWTASGALKKARKKGKKPPPELPDKYRTSTGQTPDFYRIFTGQVPDEKTLEDSKTLGLKPVFNPIKELPIQSKTTKPLTHDSVNGFLLNQPPNNYETKIVINSPTEKTVFYTQRPDETTDQYFDRAIAESTPFWD